MDRHKGGSAGGWERPGRGHRGKDETCKILNIKKKADTLWKDKSNSPEDKEAQIRASEGR